MAHSPLRYKLVPYGQAALGRDAYCIVYRATEAGSGAPVALKKSRVSKTVKRPILQHEARMLRFLSGHPAIPVVYGYGQLEHFDIADQFKEGGSVSIATVIRFLDQALSVLQHVHTLGIVHRDVKPENFLCVPDDPSIIKLIDFGISKPFSCDTPPSAKYDPLKERRRIVGSLYWASLNSHSGQGLNLSPRDDMESLALIALFLLRGNLPWKPRPRLELQSRSQEVVRIMKSACSSTDLSANFPTEFGDLLAYSRSLAYDQLPDYDAQRALFAALGRRFGLTLNHSPLDWSPHYPQSTHPILEEPIVDIPQNKDDNDLDDPDDEDSYFGWDNDIWDRQGERDKELTLPAEVESELDNSIPQIEQVEREE